MIYHCECSRECEFPCWQRVGIAPLCAACGCHEVTVSDPRDSDGSNDPRRSE